MHIHITILFLIAIMLISVLKEITFRQGSYYKMTGNGYFHMINDIGKYGEYLTYKRLRAYENDGGKFLFNCYLPKDDGTTTEVDVILIHSTGIFAIESKNYSGWIFGSEKGKTWTQTLPNGRGKARKEHFYNPIMQNKAHIKWLRKVIDNTAPIYSVIAFSERCTLKNVTVATPDVKVINRQYIGGTVRQMGSQSLNALSGMDIERIYQILYPYTQVTAFEKMQHIDHVNEIKRDDKKKVVSEKDDSLAEVVNDSYMEAEETAVESVMQTGTVLESKKEIETSEQRRKVDLANQDCKRICPRCNAELVLRTAKKGKYAGKQFYGCSRFPKCRYKEIL